MSDDSDRPSDAGVEIGQERAGDLMHQGSEAFAVGLAPTQETIDEISIDPDAPTEIAGLTPWQLALRRLRRDKPTMVVFFVVVLFILIAIAAPLLSAAGVLKPDVFHNDLIDPTLGGFPRGAWGGMSWEHPFGVEPGTGRDVLSRLLLGVTFSLVVSISATIVAVVIGVTLGLISGFLGRWPDFWISRLVDMVLAFPQTLMLLALSGMFIDIIRKVISSQNIATGIYIVVVLGFFGWPTFARIIRGQVLSMREREFVEAAKSLGARNRRIYFRELLPNLWAPILVYSTIVMPAYVSAEAALSYLGVGIKPPTPTLGNILSNSVGYVSSVPTFFFIPGITIALIVLSFNLLGDGLRDALDPKGDR